MEKTIQINQLLLERERCLSELFDLEQEISLVLGQPYPFDLPVDLPSMQKRKPTRVKKPPIKADPPIRLRELNLANEYAYRIVYTDCGTVREELHTDHRALTLLLTTALPDLRVQIIETVSLDKNNTLIPNERLYEAPPASAPTS